jgi:hypothetical protein
MRKLLLFLIALASLAFALSTAALADDTIIGGGVSGMFKPAGGGYIGPGDLTIAATTVAWGGFSCWKASAPTARAIRLINETTTTQADINCNTSTGIDLAAVSALGCSSAVCKLVTIYDQTGLLNCFGSVACIVSQATDAARFTYSASGGAGSKPCAVTTTSEFMESAALITSLTQPFSMVNISSRTGANYQGVLTFATSLVGQYWSTNANNFASFSGSFTADVAATDASFHSLATVFNGASTIIGVDGSSTTGLSAGTNASGTNPFFVDDTTNAYSGTVCEFWILSGGLSTANIAAISSNAHTRYGF